MATGARPVGRAIDRLRRFVGGRRDSDARLLADFVRTGDESAFEALVQRHGPMVLGVCRRILAGAADADDAFQATFLVFVRKAGSISKRESPASWLHGVAFRTALKARTLAAKRRFHERRALPMNADCDAERAAAIRDLRPVLDEELARLPAKYREPLILCYLEGKSKEEIAKQLAWPHGTVSGRLARARDVLRGRLSRRGLALPAVGFTFVLAKASASAAVPASLLATTLQAASVCAAGNLATAGVSASVTSLSQGVLHTMMLSKLKLLIAVVAAAGLMLTGVGAIAYNGWAGETGGVRVETGQAATKGEKPAAGNAKTDAEKIIGVWHVVDAERGGQKPPEGPEADAIKTMQFVFTKDSMTLTPPDGTKKEAMKYTLDPAKKPKTIELTPPSSAGPGEKLIKGIYKFEGETLTLCMSNSTKDGTTPTGFTTKDDRDMVLFVLKKGAAPKAAPETEAKISEARNRALSQNNLKQIGLAFHNYHSDKAHFPGAAIRSKDGKALLSWRVAILPYIEQDALKMAFKLDEPWDSEHNKQFIARMPKIYMLPGKKADAGQTFYRVFVGKGTLFEKAAGAKLQEITDGTSNTILAVEAAESTVWTKPEELAYADNAALPKLGGYFSNGFNVLICDGSVHFVSNKAEEGTLRLYITPNDGQVVDFSGLDPKKK